MVSMVDPRQYEEIVNSEGESKAVGLAKLRDWTRHLLQDKKATPEQFSIRGLGLACGLIDPYHESESLQEGFAMARSTERVRPEKLFHESNPGLHTNAFQVIVGDLISTKVIEGYNMDSDGMIGERLVMTQNVKMRNTKIAGFTAIGGPTEVKEGQPYDETGFEEKYVTTREAKKGRIVSLNEELILMDQTGEIMRRAMGLGMATRQERERTIIRGVIDADSSTSPVYRPTGTGETLYNTDGSNYNYIGSGNTTSSSFATASALQDWTDIDLIRLYRATEVKDDRIDGTARAIAGLNSGCILLVPEALRGKADYIYNATEIRSDATNERTKLAGNPIRSVVSEVLSSPFIDEVNAADYFLGKFNRQFVWTEIWPVQTFTQGGDSEAAFERDTTFRYKVRYYGGISATDSIWVTKIDGA